MTKKVEFPKAGTLATVKPREFAGVVGKVDEMHRKILGRFCITCRRHQDENNFKVGKNGKRAKHCDACRKRIASAVAKLRQAHKPRGK